MVGSLGLGALSRIDIIKTAIKIITIKSTENDTYRWLLIHSRVKLRLIIPIK